MGGGKNVAPHPQPLVCLSRKAGEERGGCIYSKVVVGFVGGAKLNAALMFPSCICLKRDAG